jgi:hypothetical protein
MSKTVTIPTGGGNPFVVILGGIKYVYKPGETVEVPDGVALEIEEWERWHEKYYGENVPPFASPIDDITAKVGQTIVVKSVDENGKPTEWEAVDKADKVNHGRLLAAVAFTEDTTGVVVTNINADVTELAVLIEATTSVAAPVFTINNHAVTLYTGSWGGGSHVFVKIDKDKGEALIKSTSTNKGRNCASIQWDKNEIIESVGISKLGFASGDFFRVYEGLLSPQLREGWSWND